MAVCNNAFCFSLFSSFIGLDWQTAKPTLSLTTGRHSQQEGKRQDRVMKEDEEVKQQE